jgi:hypothetical protein
MPYWIETYADGVPVDRLFISGTEQGAIDRAHSLWTAADISFVRVIRVEFETMLTAPRSGRSVGMPKGPRGEKRPADVIGRAVKVMRIATGEEEEELDRANPDHSAGCGLVD